MIFIIKTILKIASTIAKLIYGILKSFRLQFVAVVLLVGGILFLTKVVPENETVLIILYVALGLSCVYALIANYNRITKPFQSRDKGKNKNKAEGTDNKADIIDEKPIIDTEDKKQIFEKTNNNENYPKYYNVRQNSNYIMAEYKDRYELFLKKDRKLIKIRTDYKREKR